MKLTNEAFTKKAEGFLREYLEASGKAGVVIGLSGGIDSAVAATIAVRAIGKNRVKALTLPNGKAGDEACGHAAAVAKTLGITPIKVDIGPACNQMVNCLGDTCDRRRGNIAARLRMIALYDFAAKNDLLVLGTENKTEHYLGYFTKAGDEVSDIELIRDLYKTEVRDLARFLGVPTEIIDKPPTADLWQGQTDEDELGFTYEEADRILALIVDQNQDPSGVIAEKVKARMKAVSFKLQDVPYVTAH
jgi:NAD+ synthase